MAASAGDIVDGAEFHSVGGAERLGVDVGLRGWADERHPGPGHRDDVAVGDQLGVAHQQELAGLAHLPQRLHGPDHLVDLPGAAVEGAVEDGDAPVGGHPEPGLDLLEVDPAVLRVPIGRLGEAGLGPVVVAEQRDGGHVPVDAGCVDPEPGDGVHPHRAGDARQHRRHGVEGTAHPVVVEGVGPDAEHLGHRPLPRPVLHVAQRLGGGQPVGDQCLDHLAVGGDSHVTHRTGPVHDPANVESTAEIGDYGQRAQDLVAVYLRGAKDRPTSCHGRKFAPRSRISCKELQACRFSRLTAMCGTRD